jgi:hypothetical protein
MDIATLAIMAAVLFIAWIFTPIIVVQYRKWVVPKRYEEMREQLMREADVKKHDVLEKDDPRCQTAAWHYWNLHRPDTTGKTALSRFVEETHSRAGKRVGRTAVEVDDKKPEESKKLAESAIEAQFWHYHSWKRYIIPLCLVMALSGLMLAFIGLWVADRLHPDDSQAGLISRIDSTFVMALLGALTWSIFEILRRRNSGDLTPVELNDVVFRFVTAIPIGYAFSLLVFDKVSPWLAFVVSAFPLRDLLQLIRKLTLRKIGETPISSNSTANQGNIGQVVSGISDDAIVRLQELNIVTCMDLAYADPVKLMIKTGAPILLVLGWIDKALMGVYAAPHVSNFERLGLPCALDICEFYCKHCFNLETEGNIEEPRAVAAVKALAEDLKVPDRTARAQYT